MDYKALIIKTIQSIQKSSASSAIRDEWERLIATANTAPAHMLPRMYQELREVLAESTQDPSVCVIKVKCTDGKVRSFANLKEFDEYANKHNGRRASRVSVPKSGSSTRAKQ